MNSRPGEHLKTIAAYYRECEKRVTAFSLFWLQIHMPECVPGHANVYPRAQDDAYDLHDRLPFWLPVFVNQLCTSICPG